VLRGELYDKNPDDSDKLSVRNNIYVIPNAIVAEQFMPGPPLKNDIGQRFHIFLCIHSTSHCWGQKLQSSSSLVSRTEKVSTYS
jgi:hypothetical protein